MPGYHGADFSQFDNFEALCDFIRGRQMPPNSFKEFELELGKRMRALRVTSRRRNWPGTTSMRR